MAATIYFGKDQESVNSDMTIEQAVSSLGRFPDTYLYIVSEKPVPMTTVIIDGMVIKAVRIASGG